MKEYPYIGKLNDDYKKDAVVLFTNNCFGCVLRDKDFAWEDAKLHEYCSDWIENGFTNITYEYLANTKIKIQSKEHEKFVRSLIPDPLRSFWDYKDNDYLYLMTEMSTQDRCKEITIPIPPPMSKENPDTEEWPRLGDEVSFPSGEGILVVDKPDKNGIIIVKSTDEDSIDEYKKVSFNAIKKPLTPEEKLKNEIEKMFRTAMDENYDENQNCEYFVSGLMKMYDIKKKP